MTIQVLPFLCVDGKTPQTALKDIQKAIDLKLPLEYTFSCYDPEEIIIDGKTCMQECGRCATCLDVKKAMEKNGLKYKPTLVPIIESYGII